MKRIVMVLALAAAMAACQHPASTRPGMGTTKNVTATQPGKAGQTAKAGNTAKNAKPAATQEVEDDFQRLIREFNITGDQAARINAKRDAFKTGTKALDEGPVGKRRDEAAKALADAKASKDEAKIEAAQAQVKAASDAYWERRGQLRAAVFNELTPEQKTHYVANQLWGTVTRDLRKAQMTEEQQTKARALVDAFAASYVKPDTFTKDPYLKNLRETDKTQVEDQIKSRILNDDQRAKLAPSTAPAAKSGKTNKTK